MTNRIISNTCKSREYPENTLRNNGIKGLHTNVILAMRTKFVKYKKVQRYVYNTLYKHNNLKTVYRTPKFVSVI